MIQLLESLALLTREAAWLVLLWIASIGACVGSFMNVVVYRLPAGQSLLRPGSRCPQCGHPIRWHDNLPVLSWLRLRGRCRDCGAPISPRYPLVEFFVLLLFASQWIFDVQAAAATDDGALAADVIAFVWHVSLLSVLVCVALIDFDGHATPRSLWVFGMAMPITLALLWPRAAADVLELDEVSRVGEAMLIGAILAPLVTLVLKLRRPARADVDALTTDWNFWSPLALSAMAGLYLGPQRALVTLLLTTLLWRIVRLVWLGAGRGAPWSWYLTALCWMAVALRN